MSLLKLKKFLSDSNITKKKKKYRELLSPKHKSYPNNSDKPDEYDEHDHPSRRNMEKKELEKSILKKDIRKNLIMNKDKRKSYNEKRKSKNYYVKSDGVLMKRSSYKQINNEIKFVTEKKRLQKEEDTIFSIKKLYDHKDKRMYRDVRKVIFDKYSKELILFFEKIRLFFEENLTKDMKLKFCENMYNTFLRSSYQSSFLTNNNDDMEVNIDHNKKKDFKKALDNKNFDEIRSILLEIEKELIVLINRNYWLEIKAAFFLCGHIDWD